MSDAPVFATALRGYDRQQVDDYVATLLSYLAEAARRLEDAERPGRAVDARVGALTDRLTVLLAEAQLAAGERLAAAEQALTAARAELEGLATERGRLVAEVAAASPHPSAAEAEAELSPLGGPPGPVRT